jgi:hypothetical protein
LVNGASKIGREIGCFRLGVTGFFVKKTDIYRHLAWPRDAVAASPPGQIGTVEAGKQASGMAINHAVPMT